MLSRNLTYFLIALLFAAQLTGCAIHYYDPQNGVDHLWGVGHLRLKVQEPNEGVQAIVSGNETAGISAGTTSNGAHLALGWHDERRITVVEKNAKVRFAWPSADYFNVRVGTDPPFLNNQPKLP